MSLDVKENFYPAADEAADSFERPAAAQVFLSTLFVPAADRLLLKRLPAVEKSGLIVKPQIALEQSEYGWVVAVGQGVEVPIGAVAKFSRFSAEEMHFEDEGEDVEFVIAYKQDIRGWFFHNAGN